MADLLLGNSRHDVREVLRGRGWRPTGFQAMCRGPVIWAPTGGFDSALSRYDDQRSEYTVAFPGDVPTHVIVAACEAAAKGSRRG